MQKVILDLLPGGVAPIVYASQYDDGRSIRFMLTEGGPDSQYSLNASDVITCNLTKPDGTETVIDVANPGGGEHYVDLVNGADDYDQAGAYLGEIVLTRNATVIGSANFVLKVEEDAYGGQITTLTATGNPCTFETDLADALVLLTADIVCGGGGGTPSNPIALVPHSELNLTRCGVNMFGGSVNTYNSTFSNGTMTNTATDTKNGFAPTARWYKNNVLVDANSLPLITQAGRYSIIVNNNQSEIDKVELTHNGSVRDILVSKDIVNTNSKMVISFTVNGYDVQTVGGLVISDIQLEFGTTATAYEPYNGQTFTVAFGQTVYGGVYDKSGRLTITWGAVDLGSLDWIYTSGEHSRFETTTVLPNAKIVAGNIIPNALCSIYKMESMNNVYLHSEDKILGFDNYVWVYDSSAGTDANAFKTAVSGQMLAYELATPIVIDVPSISVFAENGTNNIVSDGGGDVDVSYLELIRGT